MDFAWMRGAYSTRTDRSMAEIKRTKSSAVVLIDALESINRRRPIIRIMESKVYSL